MKIDYLNKLVELSLRIANIVDENGENKDTTLADELGLGFRALSSYLRHGAKEIVAIQEEYAKVRWITECEQMTREANEDFLEEIFGDEDIANINEYDKERIKGFVKCIMAEWDNKERTD